MTILKATLEDIEESEHPSVRTRQLVDEFAQAVTDAPGSVIVDIRDTASLNHSSVATLFHVVRTFIERGKRGVICCSSNIKTLLELAGIASHCPCWTSKEESLAALNRASETDL